MAKPAINDQPAAKTQIKMFIGLITICIVCLVVTSRYAKISVKNLELQDLKEEYKEIVAEVSLVNIDVEAKYNLTSVEEYAKQKLGMQKPTIDQIVYIDTRTGDYSENNNSEGFWSKLKGIFKKH